MARALHKKVQILSSSSLGRSASVNPEKDGEKRSKEMPSGAEEKERASSGEMGERRRRSS
jgi:hypothetical protein